MTLVLVILAVVWIVVLVPPVLRTRAESRPADSISAFRRQLMTLRRTRPGQPQGSRLRSRGGNDMISRDAVFSRSRANRPMAVAAPRRSTRPGGPSRSAPPLRPVGPSAGPRPARPAAARPSSRNQKRRRDVLLALVTAAVATLALGSLVPSLGIMLIAHLVTDLLLVGYIALLVRQRNVLAEREMKVRFLPRPTAVEPALLRRSIN